MRVWFGQHSDRRQDTDCPKATARKSLARSRLQAPGGGSDSSDSFLAHFFLFPFTCLFSKCSDRGRKRKRKIAPGSVRTVRTVRHQPQVTNFAGDLCRRRSDSSESASVRLCPKPSERRPVGRRRHSALPGQRLPGGHKFRQE